MKQVRKISTAALALFLLLTSIGVGINKMTCLSGGKTKISLLEKPACCPTDEEKPSSDYSLDARCCDFFSDYVQVDYLAFENPLKVKIIKATVIATLFRSNFTLVDRITIIPTNGIPPLLYGSSLLKFISVFRI